MDPITAVGLFANVGQLIAATATLIQGINDIKNAPRDRANLAIECANLVTLLTQFRYGIQDLDLNDPRFSGIQVLAQNDGPLEQLRTAVEGLLKRLHLGTRGARKIMTALTWPFEKQEVDSIVARIERFKSLVSLYREGDHLYVSLKERKRFIKFHCSADIRL